MLAQIELFISSITETRADLQSLITSLNEQNAAELVKSFRLNLISYCNLYCSDHAKSYLARAENQANQLYSDFDQQPHKIIIIKQLHNGLIHAENALNDLKTFDLYALRAPRDVWVFLNSTMDKIYDAFYLFTHLDLDLIGFLSVELSTFSNVINTLNVHSNGKLAKITTLLDTLKFKISAEDENALINMPPLMINGIKFCASSYEQGVAEIRHLAESGSLSHHAGKFIGIAANQVLPSTTGPNYNYITQFSIHIPQLIDNFTNLIRRQTANLTAQEPRLNKQKIEALEEGALTLLNAFNQSRNDNFFMAFKTLKFIKIIRHIILLAKTIIEQIGDLSEASQILVCSNISHLKYELLPHLMIVIDKIEDEGMLKPGLLSTPLITRIRSLYNAVIFYAKKGIDFKTKASELLFLDDSRFVNLRITAIENRLNQQRAALFKLDLIAHFSTIFFETLEKYKPSLGPAHYPDDALNELTKAYRYLQPIVAQVTAKIDMSEASEDFYNQLTNDVINHEALAELIFYKPYVKNLIISKNETHRLHLILNFNIIKNIYKNTDIWINPFNPQQNDLAFDETNVIPPRNLPTTLLVTVNFRASIINDETLLTSEEALALYEYYQDKLIEIDRVNIVFDKFCIILNRAEGILNNVSPENKKRLGNLYYQFQSYFIPALGENGLAWDKTFIEKLTNPTNIDNCNSLFCIVLTNPIKNSLQPAPLSIDNTKALFAAFMEAHEKFCLDKSNKYFRLAHHKFSLQTSETLITLPETNRARYILKHTHYSHAVTSFRNYLFKEFKDLFNDSLKNKLPSNRAESSNSILPAELNNVKNSILSYFSPSRIYSNTMFALKNKFYMVSDPPFPETDEELYLLSECSQIVDIKLIFNCLYYFEKVVENLEKLDNSSLKSMYVKHVLIMGLYLNKIYKIYQYFQETHQPTKQAITNKIAELIALFNSKVTEFNNHSIKKRIDRIAAADSTLKLFLQIPNTVILVNIITQSYSRISKMPHAELMAQLQALHNVEFAKLLLAGDRYELTTYLHPGTLTKPLQKWLDDVYIGFLESLNLPSGDHFALISNFETFVQRIDVILTFLEDANSQLRSARMDLNLLIDFEQKIIEYNNSEDFILGYEIINSYLQTERLLTYAKSHLIKFTKNIYSDKKIDTLLASSRLQTQQTQAFVKVALAHKKHQVAELELNISSAREIKTYLLNSMMLNLELNDEYITNYPTVLYKKQVSLIIKNITKYATNDELSLIKTSFDILPIQGPNQPLSNDIAEPINAFLKEKIRTFPNNLFVK